MLPRDLRRKEQEDADCFRECFAGNAPVTIHHGIGPHSDAVPSYRARLSNVKMSEDCKAGSGLFRAPGGEKGTGRTAMIPHTGSSCRTWPYPAIGPEVAMHGRVCSPSIPAFRMLVALAGLAARSILNRRLVSIWSVLLLAFLLLPSVVAAREKPVPGEMLPVVRDRSTGSVGAEASADFILESLRSLALDNVGVQEFQMPVPVPESASIAAGGQTFDLHPWGPNLVYLSTTPPGGITGPLVYAGRGSFSEFDGKHIRGAVVLMEMGSGGNWMNAASFGASALIFIGAADSNRGEFEQKITTAPLAFPRFWVDPETGRKLRAMAGAADATITARASWRVKTVRNCYGFMKGSDGPRQGELVILEAPYDVYPHVLGRAPGADEAISAGVLLNTAKRLGAQRPERSILFLFTAGNREELAGARQFVRTYSAGEKEVRREVQRLTRRKAELDRKLELTERANPLVTADVREREFLLQVISDKAKDRADEISRARKGEPSPEATSELRTLRVLSWASLADFGPAEMAVLPRIFAEAAVDVRAAGLETGTGIASLESDLGLRKIIEGLKPVLFLSLDLSSYSPRLGILENGATYPAKENIRRITRAGRLGSILTRISEEVSRDLAVPDIWAGDGKDLAGESSAVSAAFRYGSDAAVIGGLPGVALVSIGDGHKARSTPSDTIENIDPDGLDLLNTFTPMLISRLVSSPGLRNAVQPGINGFSNLSGQAMYIRGGELFPDQPAPGTIISVFQGDSLFRAAVGLDGTFLVPGLANNRLTLEKAILETYRPDPVTGRIFSAVDKVRTGKDNYRVRVKSGSVSTSLVLFRCEQTDVLPVFNPTSLGYLTRVEVFDAVTDSLPMRYWSSRMDGRDNMAVSVFLEKGARFKLGVAETLLAKEFLLLNSDSENASGSGFLIGDPPVIFLADLQTVNDLQFLAGSRLSALSGHGIVNQMLESLYKSSAAELDDARKMLDKDQYSKFREKIVPAWAKLDVVYKTIDRDQRDVLAGVIFFIALFIPFAYCMERYLFGFRGIYQQITAFLVILLTTILLIRALHPAFQLTYSPMVVILAFFIVGLSLAVSWIIFMRFEREMARGHGAHQAMQHVTKWQAFGAGFSIGVSNLNRRRMRTALTCTTLVILTFTIMSFTNVKNSFRSVHSRIADEASYRGLLIRSQFRLPLAPLVLEDLRARFDMPGYALFPRGTIKPAGLAQRNIASVRFGDSVIPVEGILGLGENAPESLRKVLREGAWFEGGGAEGDGDDAILLPSGMAAGLGIKIPLSQAESPVTVEIMGTKFRVGGTFDSSLLESFRDLDQNPVLPAYLESGQSENISEAEVEAIQSGEQVLPIAESYRYADARRTVILPFAAAVRMGGRLEAVSILTDSAPSRVAEELSSWLSYPVFVGDGGAWYQSTGTALRYQGAANLLVPILIVVLITLNTMISHVYERQREIGTYTSVGLAPAHVGFLFIVEALSLAVISTVIGYIVAQLSAHFLAGTALFSTLTFNYSSLASIACMFLVFSVVFLAALYPARVATSIAMPDVNRIWRLPEPVGDLIRMNLPFLLKTEEERGLMNFLLAFFVAHEDSGHGSFTVEQPNLDMEAPLTGHSPLLFPLCLLFRADTWLAPFDFGIKQHVQIHCCPSRHNPGYLEIAIFLTRLSGEYRAWVRANKHFVRDLRKQILLWRLLDEESRAAYIPEEIEERDSA